MNGYLISLLSKVINLFVISFISLFNGVKYTSSKLEVSNKNASKSLSVINNVTNYTTEISYASNVPSNIKRTIRNGINGISYVSEDGKETKIIREMVPEQVVQGTGEPGEFVGKLTSYGPDCPGCSSSGNVACKTREGTKHSLIKNGIYYKDYQFGSVRILSAAREKFPCGTIISIDNGRMAPYLAVVLDSGGSMVSALKKGVIWLDLAYASQSDARHGNTSGTNVKFSVQRWGW